MTDMSIDALFKLEERHENMMKGVRSVDAKYEEL
jgi:hypothetical protein